MNTFTKSIDASEKQAQMAVYTRIHALFWFVTLLSIAVMVLGLVAMGVFDKKVQGWLESTYTESTFGLGQQYEARQEYEMAVILYREALGGTFQSDEVFRLCGISLGDLLTRLERYEEAIIAYENLPRDVFVEASTLTGYATALYRAGYSDEALTIGRAWLEKANSEEDRVQQVWANSTLGSIERQRGRSDQALTYFRTSARLDPKSAARIQIAHILRERGKLNEAIIELETLLAELREGQLFVDATNLRKQILEQKGEG